jgi:hypothetical protein
MKKTGSIRNLRKFGFYSIWTPIENVDLITNKLPVFELSKGKV